VIPPIVTKADYEAELGVVIGERVRGSRRRTRSRRFAATSARTT
jgi:2-keto-4-pentenoate hydratase/2-oxohepta-3-ene-1,7-dioic acid hydratase in catechol pathway